MYINVFLYVTVYTMRPRYDLKNYILKNKYAKMLKELEKIFNDNKFDVTVLKHCFRISDKNKLSLFPDAMMQTDDSVENLFIFIRDEVKYFEYNELKLLVEISGFEKAKELVDAYISEVKSELIQNGDFERTREYQHCDSTLKLISNAENITAEEYNLVKDHSNNVFNLPPGSCSFREISKGSIIIVFEISQKVKKYLMKLTFTANNLKPLADLKMKCYVIDNEMELKLPSDCNTEVRNSTT